MEQYLSEAQLSARLDSLDFWRCQALWPKPWERMKAKREVRRLYLRQTGEYPPDGGAPLPGDGRSRNIPANARKRQHAAFFKRIAAMGR